MTTTIIPRRVRKPGPPRYRGFSVVVKGDRRDELHRAMLDVQDRVPRWVAAFHPATGESHLFFFTSNSMTLAAARRLASAHLPAGLLGPEGIKPFVGRRGDALLAAKAVQYSMHRTREAAAEGKESIGEDELRTSPGWDWRADLAALEAREAAEPRVPSKAEIRRRIYGGEITPPEVYVQYQNLSVQHGMDFERTWSRGDRMRREWLLHEHKAGRVSDEWFYYAINDEERRVEAYRVHRDMLG